IKVAMASAIHVELISLAPVRVNGNDGFHGWQVLGRLSVDSPSQRDALIAVMVDSMERIGIQSLCFEPRHGITFVGEGRKTELVICFTCGNIEAFRGGEEPAVPLGCSDAAELWLDRQFEYESIPLAPKDSPNTSQQR